MVGGGFAGEGGGEAEREQHKSAVTAAWLYRGSFCEAVI
jgi:hypothetical protein